MLAVGFGELKRDYPGLFFVNNEISGIVEFTASFNKPEGKFQVLGNGIENKNGGLIIAGKFKISISDRKDKSLSQLPALYVEEIDTSQERHFNQRDKSACLCSPFEEDQFLKPAFQLRAFFEQLVIPFLYGQVFYSEHNCWPWEEYSHGAVGLLESYSKTGEQVLAQDCLRKMSMQDRDSWMAIKAALRKKAIKGHIICFCKKKDKIRRCHPFAWKGLIKLKGDMEKLGICINDIK